MYLFFDYNLDLSTRKIIAPNTKIATTRFGLFNALSEPSATRYVRNSPVMPLHTARLRLRFIGPKRKYIRLTKNIVSNAKKTLSVIGLPMLGATTKTYTTRPTAGSEANRNLVYFFIKTKGARLLYKTTLERAPYP